MSDKTSKCHCLFGKGSDDDDTLKIYDANQKNAEHKSKTNASYA